MWEKLKTLLDYFKEYRVLGIVLIALLALAVFAVVGLIIKSRIKKKAKRQTEVASTESPAAPEPEPIKEPEQAPEPAAEKPVQAEKPAEEKPAPAAEPTRTKQTKEKTEKSQPTVMVVKKSAAEKEAATPFTFELREEKTMEGNTNFFDDEAEAEKLAKKNGKWVICRLITANKQFSEFHEPEDEAFFFELHDSNDEKLLTSEDYGTYNGALRGIETHKANILKNNFKITLSKDGDYMFKLLSGKNLLLCLGEHYPTRVSCERAIESARRFAKTALIDENVQDIVVAPPREEDPGDPLDEATGNGKWLIRSSVAWDGEQVFYFELLDPNGERLLSSEEYTTYVGAINGITTHKSNIARGNFRVSLTKHGDFLYKLLNGNGQLLCIGEHHATKLGCERAIESVKRYSKSAPILTDAETAKRNSQV